MVVTDRAIGVWQSW